tara:strand:- start:1251 stop:2735 length:1485 start_codon:yes stop_codon:yes gene_type:complete
MPKLFGLDSSTVRQITKLFALDGSTPRRVKKLFALDGSSVRLIFDDFSTFTVSGTANEIVSPVNEVIKFGFRNDFSAGGTDTNVNASGTGDTSNVGGVSGLSVDVDSSHTYTADSDISGGFRPFGNYPSALSRPAGNSPASALLPQTSLVSPATNISSLSQNVFGGAGYNFHQTSTAWPDLVNGNTTIKFPNGSTSNQVQNLRNLQGQCDGRFSGTGGQVISFEGRAPPFGNIIWFTFNVGSYGTPQIKVTSASTQGTGRRARVQNGSNRPFNIQSGGLTAGNSFPTGALAAGASTGFITANSTSEAFTLVGVHTQNPATFSIANADNSITVSGTFGDGENASQARDRIQAALNGNSTFTSKFDTGTDTDETISGVAHKVVRFTSDAAENTQDFTITVTSNDGSNTTPFEETTTQGAAESLQTIVTVSREVAGSATQTATAISSQADSDTAGAAVASNAGSDVTYDASTNKLRVQDQDATVAVTNAGSLGFSKD